MASVSPPLSDSLQQHLDSLRGTIRTLQLLRGIGFLLSVLCGGIVACLLADWLWPLSDGLRLTCIGLIGLATAIVFEFQIRRPFRTPLSAPELAAVVENAHPELQERLTTAVELGNDPELVKSELAAYFRERVQTEAALAINQLPLAATVSRRRSLWAVAAGGLLLFCFAGPFLLAPSAYPTLLKRLFTPFGNHPSVGKIYFEVENPERLVARGSDVEVVAQVHYRVSEQDLPSVVEMQVEAGVESTRHTMLWDEATGKFRGSIRGVSENFRYRLLADDVFSQWFAIEVDDAPEIVEFRIRIEPPGYTNLPAVDWSPAEGARKIWENSQLTWSARFSEQVTRAEIRWIDGPMSKTPDTNAVPWELEENSTAASHRMKLTSSGQFELQLLDERGLANPAEPLRQIEVMRDRAPELKITRGPHRSPVQSDDLIPLVVSAQDDFGLGNVELHLEVNGEARLLRQGPPETRGAAIIDAEFSVDFAELEVKPGDSIAYRFRATDERPDPGPQETWSEYRILQVVEKAAPPGTDELEAEHNQLKQEIERLKNEIRKNEQKLEQQQTDPDDPRSPEQQAGELERLAADQVALAQRTQQLSDQLREHPLFGDFANQTNNVAGKNLPQAEQAMNDAAATADEQQRRQKTEQAREQLNDAADALQRIEQEFDRVATLERDLQELQRLSRAAGRLAESLQAAETQSDQGAGLTAEQLQQLEALRSDLEQRLTNLLNEHPELPDAARSEGRNDLQQLQQALNQLRERQDQEQQKQTSTSEQTIERRDQILERLDQIDQQLDELEQTWQAESPDTPPMQQELRELLSQARGELQRNDLADAAQRLDQAASEFDRSAIDFEQRARRAALQDSGFSDLAKQQQQLAEDLRQQLQSPADEPNPAAELAKRQAAILERANQLPTPAATDGVNPEEIRERGQEAARQTLDALLQEDTAEAAARAETASQELARLAAAEQQAAESDKPAPPQPDHEESTSSDAAESVTESVTEQVQPIVELARTASKLQQRIADNPSAQSAEQLKERVSDLNDVLQTLLADLPDSGLEQAKAEARQALQTAENAARNMADDEQAAAQSAVQDSLENLARTAAAQENGQQRHPGLDALQSETANKLASLGQQAREQRAELQQQAQPEQSPAETTGQTEPAAGASEPSGPGQPAPAPTEPRQPETGDSAAATNDSSAAAAGENPPSAGLLEESSVADAIERLSAAVNSAERQTINSRFGLQDAQAATRQARDQLQNAGQQQERAETEQARGNAGEAADAGRAASDLLQQAEAALQQAADEIPPQDPGNPVPGAVGRELGRAFDQLDQAARLLRGIQPVDDRTGTPDDSQSQQPGEPTAAASDSGSRSEQRQPQQAPQTQGEPGQPGDEAPSQSSPSPGGEASEPHTSNDQSLSDALQQLAQALSNAAQDVQPGEASGEWRPSSSGSMDGQGTNEAAADGELLNLLLQRKPGRDWGQLPGQLQTEILQGGEARSNSDYARLIKIYFDEISRLRDESSGELEGETSP